MGSNPIRYCTAVNAVPLRARVKSGTLCAARSILNDQAVGGRFLAVAGVVRGDYGEG